VTHRDEERAPELIGVERDFESYRQAFEDKVKGIQDACPHHVIYHLTNPEGLPRRICPRCGLEEQGRQLFPESDTWTDVHFAPLLLTNAPGRMVVGRSSHEFFKHRVRLG
jgi:hypothetical protein